MKAEVAEDSVNLCLAVVRETPLQTGSPQIRIPNVESDADSTQQV
jgi:hypothetical protein